LDASSARFRLHASRFRLQTSDRVGKGHFKQLTLSPLQTSDRVQPVVRMAWLRPDLYCAARRRGPGTPRCSAAAPRGASRV